MIINYFRQIYIIYTQDTIVLILYKEKQKINNNNYKLGMAGL